MAGELGLGVFELAQLLFPAGLERARHQAVVWLALVEGALGAGGVVAGALDPQLDRARSARAAVGDRVSRFERELDLLGRDRGQQPVCHCLLDHPAHDALAAGGGGAVDAPPLAVVAWLAV